MRQLRILHLTDLHFGRHYRCRPEDPTHPRAGYPELFDLICKDLSDWAEVDDVWISNPRRNDVEFNAPDSEYPLLVAVTGDLTDCADRREFASAENFLRRFNGCHLLGTRVTLARVFMTPGNHDVDYTQDDTEGRITPFVNFYSAVYAGVRPPVLPREARTLTQVHLDPDHGTLVAEINTALYVQKGTADEKRGCVDMESIRLLEERLETIPSSALNNCIRVAIMHHHPILVPELVEVGREYDAVANSRHLLALLRRYGFQIVLHGHKHYPHMFSYDSDSMLVDTQAPSMLVCGGGSLSSRELPSGKRRNTYSLTTLKWHPEVDQARVRVVTRGLIAEDGAGELAPHLWRWETLRDADRTLTSARHQPTPVGLKYSNWSDWGQEKERKSEYVKTRLNMAVCEVMPSLVRGQAYEVRAWIVPHVNKDGTPKPGWTPPARVVWSAGELFPVKTCERSEDPRFCASFNYWGPAAIQAELQFHDGYVVRTHVYARMPGHEILE